MAGHSPLLITLMVCNLLLFIANQVLSLLGTTVPAVRELLYKNNTIGYISDKQSLEITPSSPTFSIWGAIYTWQALWMIYALVNIYRRTPTGPVYTNPILLTPTLFAASIFNWLLVIAWTFVWTFELPWVAFVLLFVLSLSVYLMVGLSYKALAEHKDTLVRDRRKLEIWLIRGFVQNGLAFYGAWLTVASLLNVTMGLTYGAHPQFDQSTSSTIALSILVVELILFSLSDWICLEKHSRYTFSPYIVIIVALSGSIAKNWNPTKRNSIFTAVLLGLAVMCFVVKIILIFVRHIRDTDRRSVFFLTTVTKRDQKLWTYDRVSFHKANSVFTISQV